MRIACCCLLVVALVAPALADMTKPELNRAATDVAVHGTRVAAEAWAVAKGKSVEAVVVARLEPREGKEPHVATYERWSVDGHAKFERGDRALGRQWEKKLWRVVAEAEELLDPEARKSRAKGHRDLLDRLDLALGPTGSKVVDGSVVSWSVGVGESIGGGRRSMARTAVIAFSAPLPEDAITPPEKDGAESGPVTPGEDGPRGRLRRWLDDLGPSSFSSGGASARSHGEASSETGVTQHSRVEVDLSSLRARAPRKAPGEAITPGEK